MASLSRLLSLLAVAAGASAADCPLAGPGFPAPRNLSSSSLLSNATAQFEQLLASSLGAPQTNETAWTFALFSSKENKTLYEKYYTPPGVQVGVPAVDKDSVFRIASISKVFAVWTFLKEIGDERFNDPITKYVPELANLTYHNLENGTVYDDLEHVRWEDVTLGQLASQAAGIQRDDTQSDLAFTNSGQISDLGFPVLNPGEKPSCGIPGINAPCTRNESLTYLLRQHPIFPAAHSPAYSNMGFELLAYAQEAITGVPVGTAINTNLFGALGMSHSSYDKAPSTGGVIPGENATLVGWDSDLGPANPSGSIYSSTADMVRAGQAILQSATMSPARTRRWLKPVIQTGHLSSAVGAPWEIRYLNLEKGRRTTQLYTKQGDLGNYHAALVLAPEHDLGWVVLTAGVPGTTQAGGVREKLMNAGGDVFLPAAEQQARDEATQNFVGKFADAATNSSVAVVSDGGPGLLVTSLVSRGVPIVGPDSRLKAMFNAGEFARLYPSQLRRTETRRGASSGGSSSPTTYDSKLGFRATFFNATEDGKVQDPCLMAWTALGAPLYGQVSLDDWVFHMGEDGRATGLEVRMLRLKMERAAS
ncbi:beta-lactamase [Apiospora arundinis]